MLRPRLQLLTLGSALLFGCAHTTQTGSGLEGSSAQQGPSAPVPAKQMVTPRTDAGHPPLAASPDELMKPGAEKQISEALARRGFLSSSDPTPVQYLNAVKAFQGSQGLAATGFADHETVMRLGINPKTVDKTLGSTDVKAAKANGDLAN